jgi:L-asparaginase II
MSVVPSWKPSVVETRGDCIESVHCGGAIAIDSSGRVLYELGQTGEEKTFFRSAVKIWQAAPLMECGARSKYGFTDAEIALTVSSHNGERRHTELAKQMLDKVGLPVSALMCGAHQPYAGVLPNGEAPSALHNNCSGKHAGMLATCAFHQWPLESYQHHDHPLQVEIRSSIRKAAGMAEDEELPFGVDGCGVPTYFMSLRSMATVFSGVTRDHGETRRCIAENSWCIAGENEFDTILPEVTNGRIIAKRGGAALQCINVGDIGIAIKVGDGNMSCKEIMAMRVLEKLNLLTPEESAKLFSFSKRPLTNVSGMVIGSLEAIF